MHSKLPHQNGRRGRASFHTVNTYPGFLAHHHHHHHHHHHPHPHRLNDKDKSNHPISKQNHVRGYQRTYGSYFHEVFELHTHMPLLSSQCQFLTMRPCSHTVHRLCRSIAEDWAFEISSKQWLIKLKSLLTRHCVHFQNSAIFELHKGGDKE